MDENQRAWLLLSRLPHLGLGALCQLFDHFGSADAICRAGRNRLLSLGLKPLTVDQLLLWRNRPQSQPFFDEIERIDHWLAASDQHALVTREHPLYPAALAAIPDAPPLLYVVGDTELLSQPQIAVVGSRNASITGLELARSFSKSLSLAGLMPVSGLALGVDGQAHRGALEGIGLTVAVLGTGIDRVYPKRHRGLAEQIVAEGGALVSAFPLGSPPRAPFFPQRNRIISGLSLGVLVVEAAVGSGSLITARYALEQGRELFAIPGSIHNPAARGCHELIRRGAKLVETVDHILEEVGPQIEAVSPASQPSVVPAELDGELAQLLDVVGFEATSVDCLVERSGFVAAKVMSSLLELELSGRVISVPGGYQRT